MIFLITSIAIISIYYIIKDIIDKWKKLNRNRCPFCGAYLRGYQYIYRGAKFDDKYCPRCGKALNNTKSTSDSINFKEKK